ncbi:ATP synthase F1 subunit delta [bacterium]|nr:MAG: ATP synthase F1 subunit delta [bacterium]
MSLTKAARRYAQSLLDVADDQKATKQVLDDCTLIAETVGGSRELQLFLKSPIIKSDKKMAALNELFFKNISSLTQAFIEIIVRKNRVEYLGAIATEFIKAYKEKAGIIDVTVQTASALSKSELSALKKSLEAKTGKTVELIASENKNLIGGITVKVNDTVTDGSVKHKLESLNTLFHSSAI